MSFGRSLHIMETLVKFFLLVFKELTEGEFTILDTGEWNLDPPRHWQTDCLILPSLRYSEGPEPVYSSTPKENEPCEWRSWRTSSRWDDTLRVRCTSPAYIHAVDLGQELSRDEYSVYSLIWDLLRAGVCRLVEIGKLRRSTPESVHLVSVR